MQVNMSQLRINEKRKWRSLPKEKNSRKFIGARKTELRAKTDYLTGVKEKIS